MSFATQYGIHTLARTACAVFITVGILLHHGKVFIVYSTYSHRIASQFHDELSVTVHSHDIPLKTFEQSRKYPKPYVVFREFHEGVTQEGYIFGM